MVDPAVERAAAFGALEGDAVVEAELGETVLAAAREGTALVGLAVADSAFEVGRTVDTALDGVLLLFRAEGAAVEGVAELRLLGDAIAVTDPEPGAAVGAAFALTGADRAPTDSATTDATDNVTGVLILIEQDYAYQRLDTCNSTIKKCEYRCLVKAYRILIGITVTMCRSRFNLLDPWRESSRPGRSKASRPRVVPRWRRPGITVNRSAKGGEPTRNWS